MRYTFQHLFITSAAVASVLAVPAAAQQPLSRELPERWLYTEAVEQTLPADDAWWREFDDPVLDSLISLGQDANYEIGMAMHRMEAARREIQVARAGYFPTVGLSGGYDRTRTDGVAVSTWSAQATASWELDIFGRVRANVNLQKHTYRASRAEWVGTQVSVASEIASTYIQLRIWQAQLAVAEAHISRQDTIAGLADTRFECGLASKIDVDQARGILYSTRATVPALHASIRSAVNSLGLLTGRYASELEPLLGSYTGLPDYRRIIAAGIPADLLRRRPDVVQAEEQLAAAAASVGIAKKDFLPTLAINGSIGWQSHGHGKFMTGDNLTYSIAPTLSWTVFDGLARKARVSAAREQQEALVDSYNHTVMNAYNEVDNALISYTEAIRSIADYSRAADTAREFLTLSLNLYTQGLSDFTNVANAQVSYLEYANSLIAARGKALTALVNIYRALGGGFSSNLQ